MQCSRLYNGIAYWPREKGLERVYRTRGSCGSNAALQRHWQRTGLQGFTLLSPRLLAKKTDFNLNNSKRKNITSASKSGVPKYSDSWIFTMRLFHLLWLLILLLNSDSSLQQNEITCDRKDIQEADIIGEYKQTYRYNEQVRYRCREGYQGQFTLTCGGDGWIGSPRCTEITCNRKNLREADIVYNNKQTYRYNEQVRYRCRDGNQGEFTLTCGGDGWIGSPMCRESVGCGSPPPLTDGDIKYIK